MFGVGKTKCPRCSKKLKHDELSKHGCFKAMMRKSPKEVDEWRWFSEMRGMGETAPGAMPSDHGTYLHQRRR
jgi:hypothetical protein